MHGVLNVQSREYVLDPSSILLCEDSGTLAHMSGLPNLTYFISLVDLLDSSVLQKVCNTLIIISVNHLCQCVCRVGRWEISHQQVATKKRPHANFKVHNGMSH